MSGRDMKIFQMSVSRVKDKDFIDHYYLGPILSKIKISSMCRNKKKL